MFKWVAVAPSHICLQASQLVAAYLDRALVRLPSKVGVTLLPSTRLAATSTLVVLTKLVGGIRCTVTGIWLLPATAMRLDAFLSPCKAQVAGALPTVTHEIRLSVPPVPRPACAPSVGSTFTVALCGQSTDQRPVSGLHR